MINKWRVKGLRGTRVLALEWLKIEHRSAAGLFLLHLWVCSCEAFCVRKTEDRVTHARNSCKMANISARQCSEQLWAYMLHWLASCLHIQSIAVIVSTYSKTGFRSYNRKSMRKPSLDSWLPFFKVSFVFSHLLSFYKGTVALELNLRVSLDMFVFSYWRTYKSMQATVLTSTALQQWQERGKLLSNQSFSLFSDIKCVHVCMYACVAILLNNKIPTSLAQRGASIK